MRFLASVNVTVTYAKKDTYTKNVKLFWRLLHNAYYWWFIESYYSDYFRLFGEAFTT